MPSTTFRHGLIPTLDESDPGLSNSLVTNKCKHLEDGTLAGSVSTNQLAAVIQQQLACQELVSGRKLHLWLYLWPICAVIPAHWISKRGISALFYLEGQRSSPKEKWAQSISKAVHLKPRACGKASAQKPFLQPTKSLRCLRNHGLPRHSQVFC